MAIDTMTVKAGNKDALVAIAQIPGQLALVEGVAPTWEEIGGAFRKVEDLTDELSGAQDYVKALLADPKLVAAQERVKELKESLGEARGELDALGRRMRNRRVDPVTGEVLG